MNPAMDLDCHAKSSAKTHLFLLNGLFFFSGAAGLIYEVVWTRLFSDILGSTVVAMTVTFSVFLLALAAGAWLFGRLQATGLRALALYGKLEMGIAVLSLLASVLLWNGRSWLAHQRPDTDSFLASILFDLTLSAVVIGLPVMTMGGTLPLIVGASRTWTSPRSVVTRLYGWNTLGAALGTLAAGFVLIWKLGLFLTLATAILLNLSVGTVALILSMKRSTEVPPQSSEEEKKTFRPAPIWTGLAFLSGFGLLGYEILWARMARFLLGDRTLAISTLLFIFIVCLGLASLAVPRLVLWLSVKDVPQTVAWSLLSGSLLHLLFVTLARATIGGEGLVGLMPIPNEFLRRVLYTCVLIAPPILVLGLVFPLLSWGARQLNQFPGRVIGNLYFANTVGAFLGALCASYFLSRSLGTLGGFLTLSGLLLATALALILPNGGRKMRTLALLSMLVFLFGAYRFPQDLIELRPDETLVTMSEDEYGVQVLTRTSRNMMRVRNNRLQLIYDLGHPQTSHAQQMGAHLTTLLAEKCETVLNIGTGYGITAGTYTLYRCVRNVLSIEILPFLVQQQSRFAKHNFNYLSDPRVTLIQGDGRHYLTTSQRKYDIISVNVLDPYLPGSSSLYTVEFWEAVRDQLHKGGVFTQLFWGEDLPLLARGLRTVFPTALYFPAYGGTSFNVVAFVEPVNSEELDLNLDRLSPAVEEEILRLTGRDAGTLFKELLGRAWETNPAFESLAARAPERLHTDNHPVLEYRWAHGVRNVSILDSPLVRQ